MARKAKAAVVGIGHSRIFRRAEAPLAHLAREAVLAAIADAGLTTADIDGVATNPAQPFEGAGAIDGLDIVSAGLIREALGLDTRWCQNVLASTVGKTLIHAVNAVAAGACRHAVVFRALASPDGGYGHVVSPAIAGQGAGGTSGQYVGTYGATPVTMAAFLMQRYLALYGPQREDLGRFLVENRRLALDWEWGYWRQYRPEPLTLETYMAAREISSPLRLYDCDLPVHGAAAFVVTTPERARDLRRNPAYVLGTATPKPAIDNGYWLLEPCMAEGRRLAQILYEVAGIAAGDVRLVNFYDGFSIFVPLWLEALGLCGEGQGFAALADARSRIGGSLPVNTSSGNLGAGRLHGLPHLIDAALQAMGRSGARQVGNADVSVAVVGPPHDGAGLVFSPHAS